MGGSGVRVGRRDGSVPRSMETQSHRAELLLVRGGRGPRSRSVRTSKALGSRPSGCGAGRRPGARQGPLEWPRAWAASGCGRLAMKILWFHLMPYTDLPDDFKKKHPSVWVDIDSRLFDPAKAHRMYNDFMDELEFAAESGFDGVCVNEHHQNGYGLMPSPNLIAASLARRTAHAAIVVMGNSLALYNPPIRVAEEFAMLDCISGGRLVAGFPVGTPM